MTKLIKISLLLLLVAVTVGFTSCSHKVPEEPVNYIGSKKPSDSKAVGDIIFNDGSATPYSEITNEQKENAIAVIYYAGTSTDLLGKKTLGMTINFSSIPVTSGGDCNYFNKMVESIFCSRNTSNTEALEWKSENPDMYGADNFQQIADWLDKEDLNDTGIPASNGNPSIKTPEEAAKLYPAYYKTKDMKSFIKADIEGTKFENGWYLPTYAELYPLEKNLPNCQEILRYFNSNSSTPSYLFTSTQSEGANKNCVVYVIAPGAGKTTFGSGETSNTGVYNTVFIREF